MYYTGLKAQPQHELARKQQKGDRSRHLFWGELVSGLQIVHSDIIVNRIGNPQIKGILFDSRPL